MNAKQLIEAATYFNDRPSCECDPESGVTNCLGCDIGMMATYILSAVRPDDDEPVTRERLEADENWVMVDTDVYHWKDRYGVMTSYHVTLTQQYSSLLWSSTGVVVRKVKSMGHLRRLVAALGE